MENSCSKSKFAEDPLIAHPPPAGFSARHDGIYVDIEGKDGEVTTEWLCSPFAVVARGRDGQQNGWGRRIELSDPDGVLHEIFFPDKDLGSGFNKALGRLRDHGLNLAVGAAARKHLNGLISRWEPVGRYVTKDRLGWSDESCEAYVLGDKRVIGRRDTIFLNDAAPMGFPAMTQRGTLDEWREDVGRRCRGNPILMTAISLAFAGPLLEVLGSETIGMHLRGRSSSGKTTAVKTAVSVWGRPEFMQRWRATTNALEDHAATSNGSLLALDELAQVSARDVGDAVYMLGNGQGKARSTPSGQPRPTTKWRLTFLSNGEISLADKMAEAAKSVMAGQEVRFIDITADSRRHGVFDDLHGAPNGDIFAKTIEKAASEKYGSAGPAFVEKLIASKEARHRLPNFIARLTARWKTDLDLGNDGMTERVLGHFALIAIAGELATLYGITGWKKARLLGQSLN